jgi:hypothetical protein
MGLSGLLDRWAHCGHRGWRAFFPLGRKMLGASVVGIASIVPLVLGARLAVRGLVPFERANWIVSGVISLLIGGPAGALVHHGLKKSH